MSKSRFRGIAAALALAIGSVGMSRAQSGPAADQQPKPLALEKSEAAAKLAVEEPKGKGGARGSRSMVTGPSRCAIQTARWRRGGSSIKGLSGSAILPLLL
jgi:hypothetical protein